MSPLGRDRCTGVYLNSSRQPKLALGLPELGSRLSQSIVELLPLSAPLEKCLGILLGSHSGRDTYSMSIPLWNNPPKLGDSKLLHTPYRGPDRTEPPGNNRAVYYFPLLTSRLINHLLWYSSSPCKLKKAAHLASLD